MADLVAADVTYTILNEDRDVKGRRVVIAELAFGDGVDTYPAGGVPLTKGKLGLPNQIEALKIFDMGTTGFIFNYDRTNEKIVMIQTDAKSHTHDLHLNDADVADGATTRVNAGADLLGANTGGDLLISGVANVAGVGGIVNTAIAAAPGAEPSAVTIAAQTIRLEAVGW